MKPITSFDEAKTKLTELQSALSELGAFLKMADEAISKVNSLKGTVNAGPAEPKRAAHPPATWAERVLEILKAANGIALTQKQMVDVYPDMGWPTPSERQDLYRAVSGAVAYLHKKKGILVKTEAGYQLKL
jgi:hypothetical protein